MKKLYWKNITVAAIAASLLAQVTVMAGEPVITGQIEGMEANTWAETQADNDGTAYQYENEYQYNDGNGYQAIQDEYQDTNNNGVTYGAETYVGGEEQAPMDEYGQEAGGLEDSADYYGTTQMPEMTESSWQEYKYEDAEICINVKADTHYIPENSILVVGKIEKETNPFEYGEIKKAMTGCLDNDGEGYELYRIYFEWEGSEIVLPEGSVSVEVEYKYANSEMIDFNTYVPKMTNTAAADSYTTDGILANGILEDNASEGSVLEDVEEVPADGLTISEITEEGTVQDNTVQDGMVLEDVVIME